MPLAERQGSFSRSRREPDPAAARGRTGQDRIASAWRDAVTVAVLTAAVAALSAALNLSELLRGWSAPWERFQLDELPGVLCTLALGLTWFAARRYRESGRELRRRQAAEMRLKAALADNRRLSEEYVRGQEAERKSLAQELHDELGQYLNVIKLDAVGIRDERRPDADPGRDRARAIVENCDHVHAALAGIIRRLRPVGLDELGLAAAVEHCVEAWRRRLPGTRLTFATGGELTDLPETIALAVYRLIQEALTNVAKHAAAGQVAIRLERQTGTARPDAVRMIIADDGVGAVIGAPTRGLGLIGMRERVATLGGEIEMRSAPGEGFRLTARIPLTCATLRQA